MESQISLNKLCAKSTSGTSSNIQKDLYSYATGVSVAWCLCKVHISFRSTAIKIVCDLSCVVQRHIQLVHSLRKDLHIVNRLLYLNKPLFYIVCLRNLGHAFRITFSVLNCTIFIKFNKYLLSEICYTNKGLQKIKR